MSELEDTREYAVFSTSYEHGYAAITRETEKRVYLEDGRFYRKFLTPRDVRFRGTKAEAERVWQKIASSEALLTDELRRASERNQERIRSALLAAKAKP